MSDQSDLPDTPPEVLARQSRQRPLTQQTAELIGSKEYVDESGRMVNPTAGANAKVAAAARDARQRAQAYAGGTPHAGLSPTAVSVIMARDYPAGPAIDPELGDRTPAFVNWLWAVIPWDAKVRFVYRDIWPTELPADWPPAAPAPAKKKAVAKKPSPAPSTAATA